jgi:hypothetical protein
LILTDKARYKWQHQIAERKFDSLRTGEIRERKERISLTFRKCISTEESNYYSVESMIKKNQYNCIPSEKLK